MELKQIYKKLPHGAIAEITESAGVSRSTTLRAFKGENTNKKVIKAIASYLEDFGNAKEVIAQYQD